MIDIVPTFFCLIVTILSCWHEIKREAEFQDLKTKMECVSQSRYSESMDTYEKEKEIIEEICGVFPNARDYIEHVCE